MQHSFFCDQGRIETDDDRQDYGEDRWVTMGAAYSAVLYVVYTIRQEDAVRLISARKANASEQKKYVKRTSDRVELPCRAIDAELGLMQSPRPRTGPGTCAGLRRRNARGFRTIAAYRCGQC